MDAENKKHNEQPLEGFALASNEVDGMPSTVIEGQTKQIRKAVEEVTASEMLNHMYEKNAQKVRDLSDQEMASLSHLQEGDVIFFEDPEFPDVEWEVTDIQIGKGGIDDPSKDILYFKESQKIDGEFVDHPNPIIIPRAELPEYFNRYKNFHVKGIGATEEGVEETTESLAPRSGVAHSERRRAKKTG